MVVPANKQTLCEHLKHIPRYIIVNRNMSTSLIYLGWNDDKHTQRLYIPIGINDVKNSFKLRISLAFLYHGQVVSQGTQT